MTMTIECTWAHLLGSAFGHRAASGARHAALNPPTAHDNIDINGCQSCHNYIITMTHNAMAMTNVVLYDCTMATSTCHAHVSELAKSRCIDKRVNTN